MSKNKIKKLIELIIILIFIILMFINMFSRTATVSKYTENGEHVISDLVIRYSSFSLLTPITVGAIIFYTISIIVLIIEFIKDIDKYSQEAFIISCLIFIVMMISSYAMAHSLI